MKCTSGTVLLVIAVIFAPLDAVPKNVIINENNEDKVEGDANNLTSIIKPFIDPAREISPSPYIEDNVILVYPKKVEEVNKSDDVILVYAFPAVVDVTENVTKKDIEIEKAKNVTDNIDDISASLNKTPPTNVSSINDVLRSINSHNTTTEKIYKRPNISKLFKQNNIRRIKSRLNISTTIFPSIDEEFNNMTQYISEVSNRFPQIRNKNYTGHRGFKKYSNANNNKNRSTNISPLSEGNKNDLFSKIVNESSIEASETINNETVISNKSNSTLMTEIVKNTSSVDNDMISIPTEIVSTQESMFESIYASRYNNPKLIQFTLDDVIDHNKKQDLEPSASEHNIFWANGNTAPINMPTKTSGNNEKYNTNNAEQSQESIKYEYKWPGTAFNQIEPNNKKDDVNIQNVASLPPPYPSSIPHDYSWNTASAPEAQLTYYSLPVNNLRSYIPTPVIVPPRFHSFLIVGPIPKSLPSDYRYERYKDQLQIPYV